MPVEARRGLLFMVGGVDSQSVDLGVHVKCRSLGPQVEPRAGTTCRKTDNKRWIMTIAEIG